MSRMEEDTSRNLAGLFLYQQRHQAWDRVSWAYGPGIDFLDYPSKSSEHRLQVWDEESNEVYDLEPMDIGYRIVEVNPSMDVEPELGEGNLGMESELKLEIKSNEVFFFLEFYDPQEGRSELPRNPIVQIGYEGKLDKIVGIKGTDLYRFRVMVRGTQEFIWVTRDLDGTTTIEIGNGIPTCLSLGVPSGSSILQREYPDRVLIAMILAYSSKGKEMTTVPVGWNPIEESIPPPLLIRTRQLAAIPETEILGGAFRQITYHFREKTQLLKPDLFEEETR